LTVTAVIWGLAFVAQRVSLGYLGGFSFNAIRFVLGALSLIPVSLVMNSRLPAGSRGSWSDAVKAGIPCGAVLFAGASLQQIGMNWTTAGKAAFLTGLYIILVPLASLFRGRKPGRAVLAGAVFALVGLYLLSVTESLTLGFGDILEIVGAFFWAAHILLLGRFSRRVDPIRLSIAQFLVCAALSAVPALIFEQTSLQAVRAATVPILYAGIGSVGIAYTLQAVGQKGLPSGPATLILSMETVVAAIGGVVLLGESMSLRGLIGCGLMFAGMLLAQLKASEAA
jgi:drug/metabolite transporter (DMT)-like permease